MFDIVVLLVIALSTAFAALRGGLRELSTLISLAAAAGLTWLTASPLLGLIGLSSSFFGTVIVAAILFGVFFLGVHILCHLGLKRFALTGRPALFDRIGGGFFGLVRGLALIGLGYLGYSYYLDEARQPEVVQSAVTQPMAAGIANWFESFAPESAYIESPTLPEPGENATVQGYNRGDRSGLAEIVTTVTTTDPSALDETAEESAQDAAEDPIADILSGDDN